jgi:hypothetical protein
MSRHIRHREFAENLIRTIETAEEGGRRLDSVVSYLLGEGDAGTDSIIDLLVEEGYPLEVSGELLNADVPPFSTSLDAQLPGENIVVTMYASRKDQWMAIHRSSDGSDSVGWARTECLARRAAALKGKWAQTKVLAEIARGVTGEDDQQELEQEDASDQDEQEKPWKILF